MSLCLEGGVGGVGGGTGDDSLDSVDILARRWREI